MSITTNENGTLYTLKTVTANENGTLYDLNKVYSNEDGTLYEIYTKESNPTSLTWTTGNSTSDTTSLISQTSDGFRVTVKGHQVPGIFSNVACQWFQLEDGYSIYVTCLSATSSSYHPKASITLKHAERGTVTATAKDPSEGRYKLYTRRSSVNLTNSYSITVSGFCENGNTTVRDVDATVMVQIEFAKS